LAGGFTLVGKGGKIGNPREFVPLSEPWSGKNTDEKRGERERVYNRYIRSTMRTQRITRQSRRRQHKVGDTYNNPQVTTKKEKYGLVSSPV